MLLGIFSILFILFTASLILLDVLDKRSKKPKRVEAPKDQRSQVRILKAKIKILEEINSELASENFNLRAYKTDLEIVDTWVEKTPEQLHEEAMQIVRQELLKEIDAKKEQ